MKKDLPGIYKGKVKVQNQNQKHVIVGNEIKNEITSKEEIIEKPVKKQINDIFKSPSYVYKADVLVIMNDGTESKKTIVGRTNNSLITIDDELIDVSKISKIDFLN